MTNTFSTHCHAILPSRQCGAALIIGLIMLMVLTLLGVTALSNVTAQEKMAGGLIDRNRAFQATEIALRLAEWRLLNDYTNVTGENGFYDTSTSTTPPDPYNVSGWSSNFISAPAVAETTSAPRYRIEQQQEIMEDRPTIYRISAIGFSNRAGTNVVLQSTFSIIPF